MKKLFSFFIVFTIFFSCENRELNKSEEVQPRSLEDTFEGEHFTKVVIDGVEYLILERDNNNPHEGFGFMAFRANAMLEKEDTVIAYMKAMSDLQIESFAKISKESKDDIKSRFDELLAFHLNEKIQELKTLKLDSLSAKQQ